MMPRYDKVGIAFFRDGYSIETIAGHYKVQVWVIEDKIREYIKKKGRKK